MTEKIGRVEKIEDLLNKDLVLHSVSNQINYLQIKENKTDALLKRLTIKNLPKNALVFTLDIEGVENPYFNKSNPIVNKCSDFVIIYEDDNQIKALFCEIKSFKLSRPEHEKQLESSFLFVEYVCKMLSSFEEETKLDSPKYYLFHLYEPKGRDIISSSPRNRFAFEKQTEKMEHVNNTESIFKKSLFKLKRVQY